MPTQTLPKPTTDQAIDDFLSQRRIAVAGVSRRGEGKHGANRIYRRLKECGYQVFAVNPEPYRVDGDPCYPTLSAIPGGVQAVVVATTPNRSAAVIAECWALGITRVWTHESFGEGSATPEAHQACKDAGIDCIAGGCPLMYGRTADPEHRLARRVLALKGRQASLA